MPTDTRSAGTGASETSVGTRTWSTQSNITASDDARAVAQSLITGQVTHYLQATNFGFAIPAGSTINGIQVNVEKRRQTTASDIRDHRVRIVKGGVIGSTDKADTTTNWSLTTDAVASYGGPTDLWGDTWTVADINASNFGAVIAAEGFSATSGAPGVDHIQIAVTYTAGGVTLTPAVETDAAQALSVIGPTNVSLTPAAETDEPRTVAVAGNHFALTPAAESDTAQPVAPSISEALTPATESDVALTLATPTSADAGAGFHIAPGDTVAYIYGAELPGIVIDWTDPDGTAPDFSSGWTFELKVGFLGSTALLTKTSGIGGSDTLPNITVSWAPTGELNSLTPATYSADLTATRMADNRQRKLRFGIRLDDAVSLRPSRRWGLNP